MIGATRLTDKIFPAKKSTKTSLQNRDVLRYALRIEQNKKQKNNKQPEKKPFLRRRE